MYKHTHTPKKILSKPIVIGKHCLIRIKIDIENYRYTIYVTEYLTIH